MTNLQAKILSVVTCSQFFFLLIAAPLLALGREERLVPPLPIPHVARTAAHPRTRVIAAAAATTPRDPRLITRYYRPGQLNQSIGELSTTETTADATRAWTT